MAKLTRFPHARLSLARLFTLLAIITVPRTERAAIALLFKADDLIKAARLALQEDPAHD